MNLLRRRMMMQKSGAKYPLVNGRHEFYDGYYIEVTNGSHVKIENSNGNTYINLSKIRIRQYDSSGGQSNRLDAGQNITILYGMTHARLMYLNKDMKAPIPSDLLVNHADGTGNTYKIIDRR